MPYLVDTDVLIDLTRNNQGAIEYIDSLRNDWSISTISGLELIVGAPTPPAMSRKRSNGAPTAC